MESQTQQSDLQLKQWFPDISDKSLSQLTSFYNLILQHNAKLNLVSEKTLRFANIIHFADSILAANIILSDSSNIDVLYDFGSGNGFPGLVIGIMHPKIKVVLVDNDPKKCDFLKMAVSSIGVTNVSVMQGAIEALPDSTVKYAVSRGFNTITKSILAARKSMVRGGKYYHMKGDEWASEISHIPTQLCSFWTPGLVGDYKLPVGDIKFSVVRTEKIG